MKHLGTANPANENTEKTDLAQAHDERPDWHPYKVWQQQIKAKQDELELDATATLAEAGSIRLQMNTSDTGSWKLPQFQAASTE